MSHVTPKVVSNIVLTAAALGIGYRIATSPERESRTNAPNARMTPKSRRKRNVSQVQDAQPELKGRRSDRIAAITDGEDSELTVESHTGHRGNDVSEPENAESRIGERRSRRISVPPESKDADLASTTRRRARLRDESSDAEESPSPAKQEDRVNSTRMFSDLYLNIRRRQAMEGYGLKPRSDPRILAQNRPEPAENRRTRSAESSRSRSPDQIYPTPPRSLYRSPSLPGGRYRVQPSRAWRWPWHWPTDEFYAYTIGITVFILAVVLMYGIDGFYSRQRTRVPGSIASVLFLEPLQRYTSMEAEFELISSKVGVAQTRIATSAKSVAGCFPHNIGSNLDLCGLADQIHKLEKDLVNFKLRTPILLDREMEQICNDLASLNVQLRTQDNGTYAAGVVNKLLVDREKHAQAIVDQTRAEQERIDAMQENTPRYDFRRLQTLVPDSGKLSDPEEEKARLLRLENDLAEVYWSLETSSTLALGKAFERANEDASRTAKRSKLLVWWLQHREVDAEELRVHLEQVVQHDLIREACGPVEIESAGRKGPLKRPSLHIPSMPDMPSVHLGGWYKSGKAAFCEQMCGSSDES